MNSTVNFTLNADIAWIMKRWAWYGFFWVEFTLAMNFSWTTWVLKVNKHTLSEWMEKVKSHFESNGNSQQIGITLKIEFYWCTLFHFISENEIIHILMYFIETHQVSLEQESVKYSHATKKGRTWNKIHSNTKLPLGALKHKLVEFPPNFTRTHFDYIKFYNIRAKCSCHCPGTLKTSWANWLKKHFFALILEENKQTNQLFLCPKEYR